MPTYTYIQTQDVSIILQEAWFRAHTLGLGKIFDWVNPYPAPSLYVVKSGEIERWDDEAAYAWIRDRLCAEAVARPTMTQDVAARYVSRARLLDEVCRHGCPADSKALLEYLDLFLEALIDFIIIYHLVHDERTPSIQGGIAREILQRSSFLERHDRCIRASLLCIYPAFSGLETVIRYREVKYYQTLERETLTSRLQGWVVIPGEVYEVGTLESFAKTHPSVLFKDRVE